MQRGARRSKGPRGRLPDNFDNFIIDKIPPKLPTRLKLYVNPFAASHLQLLHYPCSLQHKHTHIHVHTYTHTRARVRYDFTVARAGYVRAFGKFKSDLIYVANYKIPYVCMRARAIFRTRSWKPVGTSLKYHGISDDYCGNFRKLYTNYV